MCERATWRSFDTSWINGMFLAIQQCTECGSHRSVVIEDAPVIGIEEYENDKSVDDENSSDVGNEYSGVDLDEVRESSDDEGW